MFIHVRDSRTLRTSSRIQNSPLPPTDPDLLPFPFSVSFPPYRISAPRTCTVCEPSSHSNFLRQRIRDLRMPRGHRDGHGEPRFPTFFPPRTTLRRWQERGRRTFHMRLTSTPFACFPHSTTFATRRPSLPTTTATTHLPPPTCHREMPTWTRLGTPAPYRPHSSALAQDIAFLRR